MKIQRQITSILSTMLIAGMSLGLPLQAQQSNPQPTPAQQPTAQQTPAQQAPAQSVPDTAQQPQQQNQAAPANTVPANTQPAPANQSAAPTTGNQAEPASATCKPTACRSAAGKLRNQREPFARAFGAGYHVSQCYWRAASAAAGSSSGTEQHSRGTATQKAE